MEIWEAQLLIYENLWYENAGRFSIGLKGVHICTRHSNDVMNVQKD